jgi:2-polyprenyl-3-methyl-5-hydroxy-6-metoxy-1,4-benzoquinol methylase
VSESSATPAIAGAGKGDEATVHALTSQQYWENVYGPVEFSEHPTRNAHFDLLFAHAAPDRIRSVLEIGSYPGPFLAAMGRAGFEVNGVDFHPENSTALPAWLRSLGFKTGDFVSADFLACSLPRRYDLVYSLGFIEHFENFDDVIAKHANLVAPGGYLLLSTPNFRGSLQRIFHEIFDRESLKVHNLAAMNPARWAEGLRSQGFDILYSGYYGGALFWVDPTTRKSRLTANASRFVARVLWNLMKLRPKESIHYSAFCGLVAVKTK